LISCSHSEPSAALFTSFVSCGLHARLDRGTVKLLTLNRLDWTHKYPAIAAAVFSLPAGQAYLDGELCGIRPMAPPPSA
jgi:ATP-dependent DNA ligase